MTKAFVDILDLSKQIQQQYLKLAQNRFHTISANLFFPTNFTNRR
jgi:hypothetical protein